MNKEPYIRKLIQRNKIVGARSRLKLVYVCTGLCKSTREKGGLVKRVVENYKSFKIFNDIFSPEKNNSSNEVMKFDVKTLANRFFYRKGCWAAKLYILRCKVINYKV